MRILKNINVNLGIKITCRRCEELMISTARLTEEHLYFACPNCNAVIVLDITIEGYKNENNKNDKIIR